MSWIPPGISEDTAYVLVALFIIGFAILRDLGRISKTLVRIEILLQEAAREADRLSRNAAGVTDHRAGLNSDSGNGRTRTKRDID